LNTIINNDKNKNKNNLSATSIKKTSFALLLGKPAHTIRHHLQSLASGRQITHRLQTRTNTRNQTLDHKRPPTTKDLNIPKRPHLQYANKTLVSTIAPQQP
jgi:hypothetical protein